MEDPDGYSTKAYHFHCTQPPLIGRSRFSTEIKLAQRRGRGGRISTEGGRGGREGVGKNILGFWFRSVSKVLSNGGS